SSRSSFTQAETEKSWDVSRIGELVPAMPSRPETSSSFPFVPAETVAPVSSSSACPTVGRTRSPETVSKSQYTAKSSRSSSMSRPPGEPPVPPGAAPPPPWEFPAAPPVVASLPPAPTSAPPVDGGEPSPPGAAGSPPHPPRSRHNEKKGSRTAQFKRPKAARIQDPRSERQARSAGRRAEGRGPQGRGPQGEARCERGQPLAPRLPIPNLASRERLPEPKIVKTSSRTRTSPASSRDCPGCIRPSCQWIRNTAPS